ncbi:MAG: hypothetical protein A2341_15175 [Deltaproteobacteria bacterium RIFOXYB12_FULL_58_9]|nr:MAG: hypothetical protein A2341_15175 [Deltaproteobacteria bacterium RIFOXYB12_FULL_58_9]
MELTSRPNEVTDITADQLRQYIDAHSQTEYLIVDVRQPEEFEKGHLPGAKLIPVGTIVERMAELSRHANLIFCCGNGGERSQRAADLAAKNAGFKVFKLRGGLSAWHEDKVSGFANLKAIDLSGGIDKSLLSAMNLEKGAERFYEALYAELKNTVVGPLLNGLAGAEEGHAREIHDILTAMGAAPKEDFDDFYESLPGDLLESGETFDEVIQRAKDDKLGPVALLELALGMEFRAHDLYAALADRQESAKLRRQLQELVDQEKKHGNDLLKGIGMLAEALG